MKNCYKIFGFLFLLGPSSALADGVNLNNFDETALATQVWRANPDVAAQRAVVASLRASATRAGLIPNPALDATVGDWAVGKIVPPSLSRTSTFHYELGLSQTFELGKRGPRGEQALAEFDAGRFDLQGVFRDRFFDTLDAIFGIAEARAKMDLIDRQLAGEPVKYIKLPFALDAAL